MIIYKVCFFSGLSYFEQFFSTKKMAKQATANFNDGKAVIEKYKI